MSYTIPLGDFEGGELLVQADDGESEIVVKHPIRGAPGLRPGSKIRGKIVSSALRYGFHVRRGQQIWPRRQHGRTC